MLPIFYTLYEHHYLDSYPVSFFAPSTCCMGQPQPCGDPPSENNDLPEKTEPPDATTSPLGAGCILLDAVGDVGECA